MKPTHWVFHTNRWLEEAGLLRYRRRSFQPFRRRRLDALAKVDGRLARTRGRYARLLDRVPFLPEPAEDRAFADIDFGSTKAYCFATGGQIFLGEASGARDDPRVADEVAEALAAIPHPETGEPAFEVKRKAELFHGRLVDRAPELVILPRDERIHIDSSRWPWAAPFERHDTLDPEHFYGYSGHHGLYGILAAAGPGIRAGEVPAGAEITQMPATLCRLLGIEVEGLDGAPIDAILADGNGAATVVQAESAAGSEASVYSDEEEAAMAERLRDLGYE
jgi:predicted AlkP superfamily phosphohydrolase/phosphomutase